MWAVKMRRHDEDWPFAAWLDIAVRIFGLSPQAFWSLSLFDWLTLISQRAGEGAVQPVTRAALSDMMDQFPDVTININEA